MAKLLKRIVLLFSLLMIISTTAFAVECTNWWSTSNNSAVAGVTVNGEALTSDSSGTHITLTKATSATLLVTNAEHWIQSKFVLRYENLNHGPYDLTKNADGKMEATFVVPNYDFAIGFTTSPADFHVTYFKDGYYNGSLEEYYDVGETVTIKGLPDGWTNGSKIFDGWNSAKDFSGTDYNSGDTVEATANELDLFAKWSENPSTKYTLTIDPNNGEDCQYMDNLSIGQGCSLGSPTSYGFTIPDGYEFDCWKIGSNTYAASQNFAITGNMTAVAQWAPITYSITYNLNDGIVSGSNPTEYTIESSDINLINPAKTNYYFAGWTGTGLSEATKNVTIPTGSTGDREYTAQWIETTKVTEIALTGEFEAPVVGATIPTITSSILSVNGDESLKNIIDIDYIKWQKRTGEGDWDFADATGTFEADTSYRLRMLFYVADESQSSYAFPNTSVTVTLTGTTLTNWQQGATSLGVWTEDVEATTPTPSSFTARISAVDIADGEEVEGTHIQLLDSEGTLVQEWYSAKEVKEITGLESDKEYKIKVDVPADGYIIPSDITFSIASNGNITTTATTATDGSGNSIILIELSKTQIEVLAIKEAEGTALSGVTVQVVDSHGNIVESWTSTTDNHVIEGLIVGNEYTLKVTVVSDPTVYEVPLDTTFVINEDGTVTSTGAINGEGTLLVEISEKTPETYTVTFNPNGGTVSPTTKEVTKDGTYGELPTPTNEKDVEFLGWYKEKVVHDDNACFDDTTVDGWVIRATPAEDMDYHNSGVHYFEVGDVLVFDITIDGLDDGIEIDKVDVNDQYLPDSDFIISANKQNIKGYTTITDDQYGYVLDFIDVEVTGNVGYTINEFALYKAKVSATDSISNSNHTLIAAWTPENIELPLPTYSISVDNYDISLNQKWSGGKVSLTTDEGTNGLQDSGYGFKATEGSDVVIKAVPSEGYQFVEWRKDNKDGAVFATDAEYTFTALEELDLYGIFQLIPEEPTEDLIWIVKDGDVLNEVNEDLVEFWVDYCGLDERGPGLLKVVTVVEGQNYEVYNLEDKLLFTILKNEEENLEITIAENVTSGDNIVYEITDDDIANYSGLAHYKNALLQFDVTEPEPIEIVTYIVTFDSDGGSEVEDIEVVSGDKVTKPTNPTKSGFTFKEWQKDGAKYDFNTPITENIDLKAVWTKNSTTSSGGSLSYGYKITTKINNGTITPSNKVVKKNANQEFTFKANEGYEIIDVLVDGKSVGTVDKYSFEKVTTKHTIEVKTDKVAGITNIDDWAKEEMARANEAGLIPETFVKLNASNSISRKDFAAVAVKLYEAITTQKATPVANNPFTDTTDEYVLKAYALGITNGVSETEFGNGTITREQMATMTTRTLRKAGIDTSVDLDKVEKFADDSLMSEWGRPSVYNMASVEIIKGVGDNRYNPLGSAKIEEALAIALRCVEVYKK